MSTKNLSRTVIEGGRRASSRFARRHSHGPERASAHVLLRQLSTGLDPESAVFLGRPQVWKSFSDKLGPARRWLRSQAGRPWDKVRSELFARFHFGFEMGRRLYGADHWVFEWTMLLALREPGGAPFTASVEMLDVVTLNRAGEVTRKDVYMNGAQTQAAFARAGIAR